MNVRNRQVSTRNMKSALLKQLQTQISRTHIIDKSGGRGETNKILRWYQQQKKDDVSTVYSFFVNI